MDAIILRRKQPIDLGVSGYMSPFLTSLTASQTQLISEQTHN
jgi:hypothetical protein